MFSTPKKIIKDICTLANGEDYCIVGIAMLVALALGIMIFGYVLLIIHPLTVSDVASFMQAYSIYNGSVVTSGGVGKILNNKAEPNS